VQATEKVAALAVWAAASAAGAVALVACDAGPAPAAPEGPGARAAASATDESERAVVVFHGRPRAEVEAALAQVDGRLLATFDEPAAVVRLTQAQAAALEALLPGVVVARGPIEDAATAEIAPAAVGFWNRRHGVAGPRVATGPVGAALAPAPAAPARPAPLGPPAAMSTEAAAAAERTLRAFVDCLAAGDPHAPCFDGLFTPAARAEVEPLLSREARAAGRFEVDAADFGFVRVAYDGVRARYEMQRQGRPTATIDLETGGGAAWTVASIDP
jgi:hypothetical protein